MNALLVAAKIGIEAALGEFANKFGITSAVYDLDTDRVKWSNEVAAEP